MTVSFGEFLGGQLLSFVVWNSYRILPFTSICTIRYEFEEVSLNCYESESGLSIPAKQVPRSGVTLLVATTVT